MHVQNVLPKPTRKPKHATNGKNRSTPSATCGLEPLATQVYVRCPEPQAIGFWMFFY